MTNLIAALEAMLTECGEEFCDGICNSNEFACMGDHPAKWRAVYLFAAECAKLRGFHALHGEALYHYAESFDEDCEVEKVTAILEEAVDAFRKLTPFQRNFMYNHTLLHLARAYVSGNSERQIEKALTIAAELMVLEANKKELDTDNALEVQQAAVKKLAKLRQKAGAA